MSYERYKLPSGRKGAGNQGIVDDKTHIQDVHEAGRDFSTSHPFFGRKHPFFKLENTLFIRKTPLLTLLPFFFSGGGSSGLWTEVPTIQSK